MSVSPLIVRLVLVWVGRGVCSRNDSVRLVRVLWLVEALQLEVLLRMALVLKPVKVSRRRWFV